MLCGVSWDAVAAPRAHVVGRCGRFGGATVGRELGKGSSEEVGAEVSVRFSVRRCILISQPVTSESFAIACLTVAHKSVRLTHPAQAARRGHLLAVQSLGVGALANVC